MWTVYLIAIVLILYLLTVLVKLGLLPWRPAKFPRGPFAWPIGGNLPIVIWKGSLNATFKYLIPKYGPIFSVYVGLTPAVVINNAELVKEAKKLKEFQGRADIASFKLRDDIRDNYSAGIGASEGPHYDEQRIFLVKVLRQLSIANISIENYASEDFSSLVQEWKSRVGQPFFIKEGIAQAIENSLRRFLVGIDNEDKTAGQAYKDVVLGPDNFMLEHPIAFFLISFFPTFAQYLPKISGYNSFDQLNKNSNQALRKIIEDIRLRRKQSSENEERPSFVGCYLDAIDASNEASSSFYGATGFRNLIMVLRDMSVGGTETTTEQLNWCVLYLLLHPEVKQRMVDEIGSVVGFSRAPSKEDFNNMHYTQAAVTEIVRITSVVQFGLFNKALVDTSFHGHSIPKGTMVITNFASVNNDKDYWGDPEVFLPERFIDADGKFKRDDNVLAFGYGKRVCPGESTARFSILYFVTLLLQHFDIQPDGSRPMPTLDFLETIGIIAKPYRIILNERDY